MHTKQRASVDTSNLQERVEGQKALLEETSNLQERVEGQKALLEETAKQTDRSDRRSFVSIHLVVPLVHKTRV
jgi:hypothetical protein